MANYLWKVKAKKARGKIAAGMEVEIIRQGVSGKPNLSEIKAAFKQKYGIESGINSTSDFDFIEG